MLTTNCAQADTLLQYPEVRVRGLPCRWPAAAPHTLRQGMGLVWRNMAHKSRRRASQAAHARCTESLRVQGSS